jgi:hypothetical protein
MSRDVSNPPGVGDGTEAGAYCGLMLTDQQQEFLAANRSAAMITVGADGFAKPARVGVALLDGRLLSSGTEARARTRRLRADPRCTLFVFDPTAQWLGLETNVTVLDGPDAHRLTVELFRLMQGRPTGPISWFGQEMDEDTFLRQLVEDERVLYEFDVVRAYGLVG